MFLPLCDAAKVVLLYLFLSLKLSFYLSLLSACLSLVCLCIVSDVCLLSVCVFSLFVFSVAVYLKVCLSFSLLSFICSNIPIYYIRTSPRLQLVYLSLSVFSLSVRVSFYLFYLSIYLYHL